MGSRACTSFYLGAISTKVQRSAALPLASIDASILSDQPLPSLLIEIKDNDKGAFIGRFVNQYSKGVVLCCKCKSKCSLVCTQ